MLTDVAVDELRVCRATYGFAKLSAPTAPFSLGCTPNSGWVHVQKDCLSRTMRRDRGETSYLWVDRLRND